MTTQNEALKSAVRKAVLSALSGYLVPPRRIVKAINAAIDAAAVQEVPKLCAPFPGMDIPWTEEKKSEFAAVLEKYEKSGESTQPSAPLPQGEQCPSGLIDLLKSLRPTHGAIGSRDADVTEQQRKIDDAIAMLAATAQPVAAQPAADQEFENFHRQLCERFDCRHDEIHWKRDQISLIEHIANLAASTAQLESKDAERYIYWRDIYRKRYSFQDPEITNDQLDASIDAAIAASKSNGSGE